jgi:hypothetical protein
MPIVSGYSYFFTWYKVFSIFPPHLLHTSIPPAIYINHQYRREHNNATPSFSLSLIEQHELCVAFVVRSHCGNLHHTVPHNESRVTCLAVYSNILFYNLDEASSNAVSSRGGIVAKYLFFVAVRFSALIETHNILVPVYTYWQVVSIQPLYRRVNTFCDEFWQTSANNFADTIIHGTHILHLTTQPLKKLLLCSVTLVNANRKRFIPFLWTSKEKNLNTHLCGLLFLRSSNKTVCK